MPTSEFSIDQNTGAVSIVGTNPADARCLAAAGNQAAQQAVANFGCYVEGSGIMTPPAAGTFGTMRRNIFRGPGYHNWDFSVTKAWTFHERVSVQLRGEFFNILNHPTSPIPMASVVSWETWIHPCRVRSVAVGLHPTLPPRTLLSAAVVRGRFSLG